MSNLNKGNCAANLCAAGSGDTLHWSRKCAHRLSRVHLLVLTLATTFASLALGAPVNPTSYDMNNGRTGTYAYWDSTYSGSGSVTTDNAWLSGGLGDLTDGVTTDLHWYEVENLSGTGPYVGWWKPVTPSLTIRFNFAGGADIDAIHIHADDAGGIGDVFLPSTVSFRWDSGSASFDVVDPNSSAVAPAWLDYAGLGIANASFVEISFGYNPYQLAWIFVDEVRFANVVQDVPEPSTCALMLAGLGAVGFMSRRRKGQRPQTAR